MKIAISQPTFLPWQGYMALLNYVDEFIILDNVQFDKRSWQQRNKIKQNNKELLITIPVKTKNKYHQKINEVEINYNLNFTEKHLKSIYLSYKKSKFFNSYFKKIEDIYNKKFNNLIDLNLSFLNLFKSEIEIETKMSFVSELKLDKNKHELIDKVCNIKKCDRYISSVGAENYLEKLKSKKLNYQIEYFDFKNIKYSQLGNKFLPFLSFLDLLFNLGKDSKLYLEKNIFILKNK